MIKLSDYLNYLNDEVIQARKQADVLAIKTAKEYAKHDYLRYFTVPRFTMPKVNMEIPIKISELDAETKYNFKMDTDSYIAEVNTKIKIVNAEKGFALKPISKSSLKSKEFTSIVKKLENTDYRFVKNKEETINKVDFNKPLKSFVRSNLFSTSNTTNEKDAMAAILKESIASRYTPVATKLNNIFIDPDTSKESDKNKLFLKLNVEMVEEGIRINSIQDAEGNNVEEIVFE